MVQEPLTSIRQSMRILSENEGKSRMNIECFCGYLLVPVGTSWHMLVPVGICWHLLVSDQQLG